ncbi:MAG: hypothetical protein NZ898_09170 [Myxococcota bacterium]|nr:hypothetical protein [Myxococcota bacterium]MDW8363957.1 hypothetical protein [Myxococcales bacterium]
MTAPHLVTLLVATLAGCEEPEIDAFRRQGGTAPDPTGVIEGTVLYVGPRPTCERNDAGDPVRVRGRVVLTLFRYDNPPPPEGGATTAANLLTIPGRRLFSDLARDCAPADPMDPAASENVMRSVAFRWPEIELRPDEPIAYQIRGFFDHDEDFNPFFSVRNLPTRGDIAGGAFIRTTDVPPRFLPIELPAQVAAPHGALATGVTVTLGARVMTERPMFHLDGATRPLASEARIPRTTDATMREQILFDATNMRLRLYRADATFTPVGPDGTPGEPRPLADALAAAGVEIDFADSVAYAFYVDDVDANRDGERDLHPILGSAGIQWQTPIVIFRRHRDPTSLELAAGIPDVLLIATIRPTSTLFQQVFPDAIEVVVPPVAAVQLGPSPICRIPYITPEAFAESYERIAVECQEVPTGLYAVNVIQGNAGGMVVDSPLSPTGKDLMGGNLSGQAWSIPNPLGDPVQLGDPMLAVPEQGMAGAFLVHDPRPDVFESRRSGTAGCGMSVDAMGTMRAINYRPLSDEQMAAGCCDHVAHLCNVPLCAPVEVSWRGATYQVRGQPTRIVRTLPNGRSVPDCVPFEMPAVCCPDPSPAP